MSNQLKAEKQELRFVQKIIGKVQTTGRDIAINLNLRNLIVIGKNGSGKTSFLKALYGVLINNISEGHIIKLEEYKKNLADSEINLVSNPGYQGTVDHYQQILAKTSDPFSVTYASPEDFCRLNKSEGALIRYYEATRKIAISKVTSASPLIPEIPQYKKKENLGINLEQHLVNLEIGMALAMRRSDYAKTLKIEAWFSKFQEDLKFLFEDSSIHLMFDDETLSFTLKQDNRPAYSFQGLSSGYLAIFDIYADLLVRSEYLRILPTDLFGVVLIDELDAHLHISLQRKILPFFTRSFPGIQFIVTTHSPFVVSSTDDALIYDISSGKECEDLSLFSLEHIVEGVLGVPPISQKMEDLITELNAASHDAQSTAGDLKKLLIKLAPYVETLDDESKMFYEMAKNKYLVKKMDERNV
jgi:AAA15 family ATPase/GTPase